MSTAPVMPLHAVVVGLGKTGFSVARYLLKHGSRVAVTDNRAEPPELAPEIELCPPPLLALARLP